MSHLSSTKVSGKKKSSWNIETAAWKRSWVARYRVSIYIRWRRNRRVSECYWKRRSELHLWLVNASIVCASKALLSVCVSVCCGFLEPWHSLRRSGSAFQWIGARPTNLTERHHDSLWALQNHIPNSVQHFRNGGFILWRTEPCAHHRQFPDGTANDLHPTLDGFCKTCRLVSTQDRF